MLAVRKMAWCAAVIETRGKIRCVENPLRASIQLILQVQSSRIAVVDRVGELTGSNVTYSERKKLEYVRKPCLDHCTDAHAHVANEIPPMALWAVTGAAAAIVLDNLIPFIVVDDGLQLVVDNVIAGLPKSGQGRPAIEQAIIRLRKKGWRIPDGLWPEKAGD